MSSQDAEQVMLHLTGIQEYEYLRKQGFGEDVLDELVELRKKNRRLERKREQARLHYWKNVDQKREEAQVRNKRQVLSRAEALRQSSIEVQNQFCRRHCEAQKRYYWRDPDKQASKQKVLRKKKRDEVARASYPREYHDLLGARAFAKKFYRQLQPIYLALSPKPQKYLGAPASTMASSNLAAPSDTSNDAPPHSNTDGDATAVDETIPGPLSDPNPTVTNHDTTETGKGYNATSQDAMGSEMSVSGAKSSSETTHINTESDKGCTEDGTNSEGVAQAKSGATDTQAGPDTGSKGCDDSSSNASENALASNKKRPGNPGNFDGERLAFLEEYLQAYVALEKGSKDKELFLRDVIADFVELFPIEMFGAPPPNANLRPLPPKSEAEIAAMKAKERKAYKKMKAVREAGDADRLAKAIKNWFFWRQGSLKKKADELHVGKLITGLRDRAAPRKRQMTHFLMTHPKYKDVIKERSQETGPRDRLSCRQSVAKELIVELEQDGKLAGLTADRDSEHADAIEIWNGNAGEASVNVPEANKFRASVGHIAQPILNKLSQETGLHFVLLGGEDVDGKGTFNAMAVTSFPEKYTPIDKFCVGDFQAMAQVFYKWLQMIRTKDGSGTSQCLPFDPESMHTIASSIQPTSGTPTTSSSDDSSMDAERNSKNTESTTSTKKTRKRKAKTSDPDPDDGEDVEPGDLGVNAAADAYAQQRGANVAANHQMLRDLIEKDREMLEKEGLITKDGKLRFFPPSEKQKKKEARQTRGQVSSAKQRAEKAEDRVLTRRSRRIQKRVDTVTDPSAELINTNHVQEKDDIGSSPAQESLQSGIPAGDQCALDDDGNLKPASEIPWVYDPDEEEPVLRWDGTSSEGRGSREATPDNEETNPGPIELGVSDRALQAPGDYTANVSPFDNHASSPLPSESAFSPTLASERSISTIPHLYQSIVIPNLRVDQQYDPNGIPNPENCKRTLFIQNSLKFLLATPGGCKERPGFWVTLVYKWADLEEKWRDFGIEEMSVSMEFRTAGFGWWFKNGRYRPRGMATPEDAKVKGYGTAWWKWWVESNPSWRRTEDRLVLPSAEGDLTDVHCPGKDGFVLFLVALRWWYDGCANANSDGMWTAAVRSVYETMEALIQDVERHRASSQFEEDQNKVVPMKRSSNGSSTQNEKKLRRS